MKKVVLLIFALNLLIMTPVLAVTPLSDIDQDGLADAWENKFKTDINNPDTDGDGYSDGVEIMSGFDPLRNDGSRLEKVIKIDLKNQTMERQLSGVSIGKYIVSSGKAATPTPKGEFKVRNKAIKAWSSYGLWMPYWVGIEGQRFGLHELPIWPGGYREGSNHLGKPVSHGCVRLGIGDAKIVYDWVEVGTKIIIN